MFFDQNPSIAGKKYADIAIYFVAIGLSALSACTPSFNWREVSVEQTTAKALLPCKPDRASRPVKLAGQDLLMHMAGCEAAGAMFTVAVVQAQDLTKIQAIAQDWKTQNKAQHSRTLIEGQEIAQVSIYGQPHEGKDGPGAFSAQAVETFLSSLQLMGGKRVTTMTSTQ